MEQTLMTLALAFVVGCSSDPATTSGDAGAKLDECVISTGNRPDALTTCEATCYNSASCFEVTSRLEHSQPGELAGTVLYSCLDLCIATCGDGVARTDCNSP